MTSLALVLAETSAQYPHRVALRQDNRVLSYRELDAAAARRPYPPVSPPGGDQ
ncbi:hypothetical protein ACTXG6_43390 [Pseudonocardia sp. Cha107L01]|uniref:hypothetical protein n=1 Tax=Pseudonocardia sp. Cha107L01 TaxID=3457576 RepID=UPI00403E9235